MKQAATTSIRKRLLLWISLPILFVSALIILLAFIFSWYEIEEVYDAQLVHTAKTLLQLTQHELLEGQKLNIELGDENSRLQHRYENKTAFRIWYKDEIVLQSHKAKEFADIEAAPGFSDIVVKNKPWRFFVFIDPDLQLRIETSERYAIRYELIGQLMLSMAIPMAFLIPSLLLIIWIGIYISLKPLTSLSHAVDVRKIDDLDAIDTAGVPAEALPLVQALNALFLRIGDSFRKEREFTDHAAHELRTPMAAMKTQTQVLMRKASTQPELKEGLLNLSSVIDRSTHLLEQLLSMARLQNERLPLAQINLAHVVQDAIADLHPAIAAKQQTLNVSMPDRIDIQGNADALYSLVRNLLDNAIKYTPAGSTIDVRIDGRVLSVADSGPGISDENKSRVLQRFVRADASGQTGSGLGLAIVNWIAEAHGATLKLKDNTPCGLIVEVAFRS